MMNLQSDLAERDDLIQQLVTKLREQIAENDRLRAELLRQTEGASAYATLSDIHRNRDLPATVRAKAAIGCLPHEMPRLTPVPPAIDATCEEIEPLAVVVDRQRARMDRMLALPLQERAALIKGVGNNGDDDTAS